MVAGRYSSGGSQPPARVPANHLPEEKLCFSSGAVRASRASPQGGTAAELPPTSFPRQRLVRIVPRGSGSVVTWRRAQMVLLSAQGMEAAAIANLALTSEDRWGRAIRDPASLDTRLNIFRTFAASRGAEMGREYQACLLRGQAEGRVYLERWEPGTGARTTGIAPAGCHTACPTCDLLQLLERWLYIRKYGRAGVAFRWLKRRAEGR
jgi:hypothetical protein